MAFGALKGVFTGNAASISTSAPLNTLASGSGAVNVGDLVYAVFGEQTASTTTTVSDNLGNTYTETQAATDGGTSTGHAYWSRVTVAGTITAITAVANGGTNNFAGAALIIEGPFAPSPLDRNPTNTTADTTSPFTCPSTTTLSQADEVVFGWVVSTGSATWSATAPNTLGAQIATAAVLSTRIGYQTVSATTAVAPAFTGTNPTDDVLGTTSFKKDVSTITQDHYRFRTDSGTVDGTPTWGANEDTTYFPDVNATFRLRFVLSNTGLNATESALWKIYASKNGGAYAAVTTATTSVKSADAGSSADNTSLTVQRLTSGTGSFANGQYDESGATSGLVITNGNFTELEFGLDLVGSDLTAGDTLDFRVYRGDVAIDTYSVTPRITVADTAAADPDNLTGYLWSATSSDLSASGSANNYSLVGASETDGTWSGQSLAANASAFVAGFTPAADPGTNGANTQRLIVRLNVTTGNANLRYAARVVRVNSSGTVQTEGFYTESSGGATGVYLLYPTINALGTWNSGDRLRVDVRIRNTSGSAGQSATIQFGHPNVRVIGPSAVLASWSNSDCCLSFGEKGHDDLLSDTNRKSQQSRIFGQYNITRSTGVIKPGRKAYWETWFETVATGSYDRVQTGIIDHLVKNLGGGDTGANNDFLGNTEGQSIGISSWSGANTTSGWYALYNNGFIDPGAGSVATAGSLTAHDGTDRVCFAVDRALDGTGKLWVKWGLASDWNGDPSANPATGTGGITISISSSGLWFAAVSTFLCAGVSDVNPGDHSHLLAKQADWLGTVPSGFTQLDGTPVSGPQSANITFAGAGALSVTARQGQRVEERIEGAGSLSVAARQGQRAEERIEGSGSLSVAARQGQRAAATFQGAGNLSIDGTQVTGTNTYQAELRVQGAGSLSIAARQGQRAEERIEGAGSLSIEARQGQRAETRVEGAGSLSVAARQGQSVEARFQGAGGLSVDGTQVTGSNTYQAEIRVEGAGSLSIAARQGQRAEERIEGVGSLSVEARQSQRAAATFPGTSDLSVRVDYRTTAAATFQGAGSLSVRVDYRTTAVSTFEGAGSLSVAAGQAHSAAVRIEGAGGLSAAVIQTRPAFVTFEGAGSLSVATTQAYAAAVTFEGAGNFSASLRQGNRAFATFAGAGSLSVNTSVSGRQEIEIRYNGAGGLSITARQGNRAFATLPGTSDLSITARQGNRAFVTLPGTGSLSVEARQGQRAAVRFEGAGSLSANSAQATAQSANVTFAGAGGLSVEARQNQVAAATFIGAGSLTASVTRTTPAFVTYNGTGSLSANVTSRGLAGAAIFTGLGALSVNITRQGLAIQATFAGDGRLSVLAGQGIAHHAEVSFEGSGVLSTRANQGSVIEADFDGAGNLRVDATRIPLGTEWPIECRFAGSSSFRAIAIGGIATPVPEEPTRRRPARPRVSGAFATPRDDFCTSTARPPASTSRTRRIS